ncbi:MAG: HXXEE domain-containing protein [Chitinophagaceae bacterium]|nr:MAG: HXXEE domain-containing protein [Chitinophagaceae bacterium]
MCIGVIILLLLLLRHQHLTDFQILLWLSLVPLFLHQFEEYRLPGTFPGMINTIIFHSDMPDRYPLNPNTSFIVNVMLGWTVYFLAALFAEKAIWLCIAAILISIGNTIAHTFLFNIKGKTFYNPGMITSWLFFVPCIYFFFHIAYKEALITPIDYYIGIPLGIILNVFGIFKMINWLADKSTKYIFENRNLLPADRKKKLLATNNV